jgi:hypothetical protein
MKAFHHYETAWYSAADRGGSHRKLTCIWHWRLRIGRKLVFLTFLDATHRFS